MWYEHALTQLAEGRSVIVQPTGKSMSPLIESGQKVTLQPVIDKNSLAVDDIVLVKVKGQYFLHLIKALHRDRVLISNNHGRVNGWTAKDKVYGRVSEIH